MNQLPPQGNPGVPYNPNNMPQGQIPQGYMPPNGQQQFGAQGQPNQPGQQPPYGQNGMQPRISIRSRTSPDSSRKTAKAGKRNRKRRKKEMARSSDGYCWGSY